MAISDSEPALLVGECKWSKNLVGINILDDLHRKAARMLADRQGTPVYYYLFARAYFTDDLKARARREDVRLVTLDNPSFFD